jgi:hypothetical protein
VGEGGDKVGLDGRRYSNILTRNNKVELIIYIRHFWED